MYIQLLVNNNKTTSWSQMDTTCSQIDTSGLQVIYKYVIIRSQVCDNRVTNGYSDSKVANTDWLIPLVT